MAERGGCWVSDNDLAGKNCWSWETPCAPSARELVSGLFTSVDAPIQPVMDTCEPASRRASPWGESSALASSYAISRLEQRPDVRCRQLAGFEVTTEGLAARWIWRGLRRVLVITGSASVRKRRLPAGAVVWLVSGMALLRDRFIDEVIHGLGLVVLEPWADGTVSRDAVIKARDRLGCELMAGSLWLCWFAGSLRHRAPPAEQENKQA